MGVGQRGIVRAPSGQIPGAPSSVPACKGRGRSLRTRSSYGDPPSLLLPNLPLPPDLQGVSWDGPVDVSRPILEAAEEPLYAVPKKDHNARFTVDDFVLHKLLGKGSFGKVRVLFRQKTEPLASVALTNQSVYRCF